MFVGRQRPYSSTPATNSAHNIVVVKSAAVKETGIEKDDDIVRLQVSLQDAFLWFDRVLVEVAKFCWLVFGEFRIGKE